MDEATWAALAATLTVAGVIWTWFAFKRRGAANGLRALGFALLPAAAWLTGTLEMVTEVAGSISDWATSLVFNPFTWTGIALAGLSVVLFVVSGFIRDRQLGRAQAGKTAAKVEPGGQRGGQRQALSEPADPEDNDIEALLRKHGIE